MQNRGETGKVGLARPGEVFFGSLGKHGAGLDRMGSRVILE